MCEPLCGGVRIPTRDASLRQDLIENVVQREVARIEETIAAAHELDAAFDAGLEQDLTIWPREYLETYLDSDDKGRIPLNEAALQDLLRPPLTATNNSSTHSEKTSKKRVQARSKNVAKRDDPRFEADHQQALNQSG